MKCLAFFAIMPLFAAAAPLPRLGLTGPVGPTVANPRTVASLRIDKPGLYENLIVDANFADTIAVRITADHVTLKNCEIKNTRKNGLEIYAADVTIENCNIHHCLAGTFADQKDAHGITGQPTRLTVKNCQIAYVSGDCLQFDPGRKPWSDVTIDHCHLYTAPLDADAAGFKKGQIPGENALDTKQLASNPRSKITLQNSLVHGFKSKPDGGQIDNAAALNLKNNVQALVDNCTFYDNDICLRLRGPGPGKTKPAKPDKDYGGAHVTVTDCRFYDSHLALRLEDNLDHFTLTRPAFGKGITRKIKQVKTHLNLPLADEQQAPPLSVGH
jgi:hypothetical protein